MKNKIVKSLDLLKILLKTSYNTTDIINAETGKINKKSFRVWMIAILSVIVICLSYNMVNLLKKTGINTIYMEIFFEFFHILIMLEAVIIVLNVIYFQNDIKNYIYMPISSLKLFLTKFGSVLTIIFGTELLICIPSIFIYGVMNIKSIVFYPISIIVIFLVTLFLVSIITIIASCMVRLFKFIKKKNIYQGTILIIMTFLILGILMYSVKDINKLEEIQGIQDNVNITEENQEQVKEEINGIIKQTFLLNRIIVISDLGIKALSELNFKSIIYIAEMLAINIIPIVILVFIGKKYYLKSVLYIISMFKPKKTKKINIDKKCKARKKEKSYLITEIKNLLKNQTFFMQYIYKTFIILLDLTIMIIAIFPIFKNQLLSALDEESINSIATDFEVFSIIIGVIQILFTISASSLTAFTRYGKNAIFFKYIPINQQKQFLLKNVIGIVINTLIILTVTITIKILVPEVSFLYLLSIFIITMLLNFINCYILTFIDLWRPQLNLEGEVSIIKQNENRWLKYILTVGMCFVIWYIKEITKELSMNTAILIEIGILTVIFILLNIKLIRKKENLFKNII